MITHEMKQGSEEWHDIRKLKLTASHAQEIATAGKGLDTYTTNIIAEYFGDCEDRYCNEDMERGHELEDEARTIYELETGTIVDQVGFIELDKYLGCSPDGLIGEDGGIEIKNHNSKVFSNLVLTEKIDRKYYMQIQMNLLVTSRKWWDYVAYNPSFKRCLFIKRIFPDQKEFDRMEIGFIKGKELIMGKFKKINKFLGGDNENI